MLSIQTLIASYALSSKLDPQKCERIISQLGITRSGALDYIYPNNIKLSTAHLRLTEYSDLKMFIEDCCHLIDLAVQAGSQLILFPHLLGLAPISVDKPSLRLAQSFVKDIFAQTPVSVKLQDHSFRQRFNQLIDRFSDFLFDCYYSAFLLLAHRYNIYIAAGSTYIATARGVFCRSFLFSPDHDQAFFQDKLTVSPMERRLGVLTGSELKLFESKIGKICILTDTDAEFFECFKVAKNLGAKLVLTPAMCSEVFSHTPRFNASLMGAQHYNLFTARSSFYSAGDLFQQFPGASGIYAPLWATKNLDGLIVHSNKSDESGAVLSSRIDPSKLEESLDSYTHDINASFCESLMTQIYPEHFIEMASNINASASSKYVSQRISASLSGV